MKTKKQTRTVHYQPIIPDADSKLRRRVEAISCVTGKKMYIVVRDALEKGLAYYEDAVALTK